LYKFNYARAGAAKNGALGVVLGCSKDETNYIRELVKDNL